MNSDTFLAAVQAAGLGLSADGAIYDRRGEYARVDRRGVSSETLTVSYIDIASVAYNKEWGVMSLIPDFRSGRKEVVFRPHSASVRPGSGMPDATDVVVLPDGSLPKTSVRRPAPAQEPQYASNARLGRMAEREDAEKGAVTRVPAKVIDYSMPMTVSSLRDALPVLYPGLDQLIWYDELNERQMVDMRMFGRPGGVKPMSDALMCIYHDDIERRLTDEGFDGKRYPSTKVRDEALMVAVADNRRNKFREWIERHQWDGIPRVRTLFRDWFGGTAPPLRREGDPGRRDEAQYLGDVAEAWLIGAVKRAYSETKHEIVPVFIGQQGIGKGTVLKYLAGQDEWYRDTTVDFKDPRRFLDSVRGSIIVELGEGVQLNTDDIGTLKAFISQSSDHMRKAYARYDETYPRHFILAASSNVDTLFKDPTGARRFFPIYCDPEVQSHCGKVIPTNGRPPGLQYEVEQIWAEALAMYRAGRRWYIRDRHTVELAQTMQLYCSEERESDAISEYLDTTGLYVSVGALVTKKEVQEAVFDTLNKSWMQEEADRAWKQWTADPVGWERVPNPVKRNGRTARVYRRVSAPGTVVSSKTFNLVDADTWIAEDGGGDSSVLRMREWLEDHPCMEGDMLDTAGLSADDIEVFLEQGYIIDEGRSAVDHRYRLVMSP